MQHRCVMEAGGPREQRLDDTTAAEHTVREPTAPAAACGPGSCCTGASGVCRGAASAGAARSCTRVAGRAGGRASWSTAHVNGCEPACAELQGATESCGPAAAAATGLLRPLVPDEQAGAVARQAALAQGALQPGQPNQPAMGEEELPVQQQGQRSSSAAAPAAAAGEAGASSEVELADAEPALQGEQALESMETVVGATAQAAEVAVPDQVPAEDASDVPHAPAGLQQPEADEPTAAADEPTAAAAIAHTSEAADEPMAAADEPTAAAAGGPTAAADGAPATVADPAPGAPAAALPELPAAVAEAPAATPATDPPAAHPAALDTAAGMAAGPEVAGGTGSAADASAAAAGKKKHHLLRHELTQEAQAAAAAHLGAATAEEAAENIWKLK